MPLTYSWYNEQVLLQYKYQLDQNYKWMTLLLSDIYIWSDGHTVHEVKIPVIDLLVTKTRPQWTSTQTVFQSGFLVLAGKMGEGPQTHQGRTLSNQDDPQQDTSGNWRSCPPFHVPCRGVISAWVVKMMSKNWANIGEVLSSGGIKQGLHIDAIDRGYNLCNECLLYL